MLLNQEVIAAATSRLERRGLISKDGAGKAPMPLSGERLSRVQNYIDANRAPQDIAAFERAIGTNDLLGLNYFWQGIKAARSVARILIAPVPQDPGGSATGFMIAPNLMLTNWHVFDTPDVAKRARAQFAYEADQNGNQRVSTWFAFAPGDLFINDKHLDYCVVGVDPTSQQGPDKLETFGWLQLNPDLGKTDYGQFLSIIQHPNGEPKQVAIRENELLPFDNSDDFLTYRSDTFRGSSGSPVLNDFWDVVALHHSGKPLLDAAGNYIGHDGNPITNHRPSESEIQWIANEGGRVSRIVADIVAKNPQGVNAQRLLESFKGAASQLPVALDATTISLTEQAALPVAAVPAVSVAKAQEQFTVVLPLNVALRVESLDQSLAPVRSVPPSPAIVTPALKGINAPGQFEIAKLNFDTNYDDRTGFDERFLGRDRPAPMPTIDSALIGDVAPTKARGKILHYHHYSAMIHGKRRMPVLTACNVDYGDDERTDLTRNEFGKDEWITDPRMEDRYQLPRGFYDRWKKIDYGHLVRREDNCWGASKTEIIYANADTFHLTNCTPQHENFNRAVYGYHGLWGGLENLIGKEASNDRSLARLIIFAGPIFTDKDLLLKDESGDVNVPLAFWKVVIAPTARGKLQAFGFKVAQAQDLSEAPPYEEFVPTGFETKQVALAKIEAETMVRFDKSLKQVDMMTDHPSGEEIAPIDALNDVWFGRR